jgi:L-fucose mutarotase/ribose pyranase (RbsD/FucU family)
MELQLKITKSIQFTKTVSLDDLVNAFSEEIDSAIECSEAEECEVVSMDDVDWEHL